MASPEFRSLHENQGLEPEEKEEEEDEKNTLVVYPAQCNFSGYKYPLDWILKVQHGHLDEIKEIEHFYVQPEDVKGGGGLAEYAVEQSGDVDGKSSLKLPLQPSHIKNKQSGNGSSMKDAGADDQCPLSNPRSNSPNAHKGQRKFNWLLLLDAASFVATSRLDLSRYPADFVAISFYKMFGFPTGLGALIVRNKRSHLLEKVYFGGGTVNIQLPWEGFHAKRDRLEERFEDGTISFLSILALRHGFDALARLGRSIDTITTRTFRLARHFYLNLLAMRYPNGQPLAVIYADTKYDSEKRQGPIVTFNLLRPDGKIIGYSEMEQMAYLHDIHLRYGCFCNVGACRRHLGLQPQEVLSHYQAGHVCGDMKDVMDGKPTGAIRMSVGYMTTQKDVDTVLRLIRTSWLRPFQKTWKGSDSLVEIDDQDKDGRGCGGKEWEDYKDDDEQGRNKRKRKVWRIFVYPVKSCAPFEVSKMWAIGSRGLLYDREWLIVNSSGVPLTQKREPRLCQLKPRIDVSNRRLVLSMEGFPDVAVPLEMNQVGHQEGRDGGTLKADLCTSKVCGDVVSGLDCGEEVSRWLSNVFRRSELRLIRMPADQLRKPKRAIDEISLANFSQYLLISMNSLKLLATQIVQKNIQAKGGCGNEDDEADTEKPMNSTNLQSVPKVVEDLIWRFRPNLVIGDQAADAGGPLSPYEEESWDEVTIGQTWFKSGGPCTRCATICTDQKTGERSAEPFLTLSACRAGSATFGIHLYRRKNMINGQSNGSFSARDSTLKNSQVAPTEAVTSIHVGDPVVVVKTYDANAFNNRDQTEPIKSTQNSSSSTTNGRKLIDSID